MTVPGELGDPNLSNQVGYYEQRTAPPNEWMDDERQIRPLKPKRKKKNQNKYAAERVVQLYLQSQGD